MPIYIKKKSQKLDALGTTGADCHEIRGLPFLSDIYHAGASSSFRKFRNNAARTIVTKTPSRRTVEECLKVLGKSQRNTGFQLD